MSIAGDTQARVPGFFSAPETVISPRKSGFAWQTAQISGALTQPVATGLNSISIGNAPATGANSISIGSGTASGSAAIQIGSGTSSSNSIGIGTSITSSGAGSVAIGSGIGGAATGNGSVSINGNSTAQSSITIGGNAAASASAIGGIAIGSNAQNSAANSIGIGAGSFVGSSAGQGIAIGNNCQVNSANCVAIGRSSNGSGAQGISIGESSSCTGAGAVSIGYSSRTDFDGQINICNAAFAAGGDIMTGFVPMYVQTTTAATTELRTSVGTTTTSPTGNIACTNFSTYIFDVDIVARSVGSTGVAAYNLKFAFNRNANAASSTISSLSKTILYTLGTTTGWDVTATADTTNGRPNISVIGAASTTIRWVANAKLTKVATAS